MVAHGFTGAPVVDDDKRLVGIVTEADLVRGQIPPEGWSGPQPPNPPAATGGEWPAPWLMPLAMWVGMLHADYIHDFGGFDRPWRLLEPRLDQFRVTEVSLGCGYLAVGRVRSGAVSP